MKNKKIVGDQGIIERKIMDERGKKASTIHDLV